MLVMRLETAAAKFDRKVVKSLRADYDFNAADMRELLLEAARRIKELESRRGSSTHDWDMMPVREGQRGPGCSDW
jgi:hypothetical protein